jgi:hypothetical protein
VIYRSVPNTLLTMSQTTAAEENVDEPKTWPDLAVGLYDRLTGRNAEIAYDFDEMEVAVPSGLGEDTDHATWRLNGTVTITTRERD